MKYHDNKVSIKFDPRNKYILKSGSYEVKSFSVTPGQDPNNPPEIHAGLEKRFGSNGEMSFRVGRNDKPNTVAGWFTGQVSASQTTFGHDPGSLNFAFLGPLTLTIQGGMLGNTEATFTFPDIAIAQGSAGASNNWWFGGKNCRYIGSNTVKCMGISSSGLAIEFHFLRGGNSVSEIGVLLNDVPNWMSNLSDTVALNQLMMPGSHDAGMSELHHCNPALLSDSYTRTQYYSIGKQLYNGSRYFDIRVDYDYNNLVTYHRTNEHGCNGESLKDVFDGAVSFLNDNNQETAIFKISQIRNYGSNHNPTDTKEKINAFLNSYSKYIYTNKDKNINLAKVTLGDVRGKIIVVFDYDQYLDPATGRFRYVDGNQVWTSINIAVYDRYSKTNDYKKMKADQLEKWKINALQGADYLFLLSWTLTSDNPPFSGAIESLASEANSHLSTVLQDQIVKTKWNKPNIVYIDFLTNMVTQSIISYNFDGSLPFKKRK